ncbi:MAG: hypothetical protein INR71_00905, partial [Terriglobus roseus]|nr:hypothetical protein [Terriglobus roseus]
YIEYVRGGERMEALVHAQKYLAGHRDEDLVMRAAGLLAFSPDMPCEATQSFFSDARWDELADRFVKTHHQLYSIPSVPQLHTALSAGLSALKTPACHSRHNPNFHASQPATNGHAPNHQPPNGAAAPSTDPEHAPGRIRLELLSSQGAAAAWGAGAPAPPPATGPAPTCSMPICPICSTELNALARNVPYAHHSKSHVDHDPVVLPNGRIYGSERLRRINEKLGTERDRVRDPLDGAEFDEAAVRKVFIS